MWSVCGWWLPHRFKQPHLTQVRVWVWIRLHTCDALTIQRKQVKPATTTHTQVEC